MLISEDLKERVLIEVHQPYIYDKLIHCKNNTIKSKSYSSIFETLSQVCVAFSGVISFASVNYDHKELMFIAGSLSPISLVFSRLSTFYSKKAKQYETEYISIMEKHIGFDLPNSIHSNENSHQENSV